jgi:rubrerythrin
VFFGTLLFCFPFWLARRRRSESVGAPGDIQFVCRKCGVTYQSNPLVCIECGHEEEMLKQQT